MTSDDVERRLTAILSADAVGYSRLMAQDEGGTIRTITAHREAIASCIEGERGRVVDSPGDNVLAEFPTALEGLRSALEIQGLLAQRNAELAPERRLPFRIGVHLGDVAVEGERIYGDGVNIAARMEALAEPGGILISDLVLRQVRGKLAASFEDLGEKQLKNIPDPVRVYRVRVGADEGAQPAAVQKTRLPLVIFLAGVLLCAGLLWSAWPRVGAIAIDEAALSVPKNPAFPTRPSIVVLPFENMSGDPDQEYFSDGLTEDLTTLLSLESDLFVISRNSAFTYKGRPVKVEDVGRELGVRYVLEGSVRRSGDQLRVTAQLIDATTGFHLWSERFDRQMAEIFALQDEISQRILAAVGSQIGTAEQKRVRQKPTEDLDAYEAWQRGYYHFVRFRRSDMAEARRWFLRAIELDPHFARPIAHLGSVDVASVAMGWPSDPDALGRALRQADRAAEVDPSLPNAHVVRTGVHINRGESMRAEVAARRAIELAPNEPIAHIFLGVALLQQERFAEALASFRTALRLDPRSSDVAPMRGVIAAAQYRLGRTDEAVELWESARAANSDLVTFRLPLIEHYEAQGQHALAAEIVREVLAVNPQLTAAQAAKAAFTGRTKADPEQVALFRRAGLP